MINRCELLFVTKLLSSNRFYNTIINRLRVSYDNTPCYHQPSNKYTKTENTDLFSKQYVLNATGYAFLGFTSLFSLGTTNCFYFNFKQPQI